MTVDEKAKEFAAKFLDDIKEIIADAYIEGYDEGFNEAASKQETCQDEYGDCVDLDLPSRTLWRDDYLLDDNWKIDRLTFDRARLHWLPTENQCRELMTHCKLCRREYGNGIQFVGKNGKCLELEFTEQIKGDEALKGEECISFWVKSDVDDELKALCVQCSILENPSDTVGFIFCRRFVGDEIPVLTVRKPKNPA